MRRFQVLTYSICGGWENCWYDGEDLQTFATYEQAEKELNDFLKEANEDFQDQINQGLRDEGDLYDFEDYRIREINVA